MKGYFVLGSANTPPPLSVGTSNGMAGNHTGSRTRGQFEIFTDVESKVINMPSRDKQVMLWEETPEETDFVQCMSVIDSEPGTNYREKLLKMLAKLPRNFVGAVNNVSTSTHGSLAILGDLEYFGLHDLQTETSYFVWGTSNDIRNLQLTNPLRYLLYRFPPMPAVFLPGETTCSKWWRWTKNNPLLHAFNALEMRLNNGQAS